MSDEYQRAFIMIGETQEAIERIGTLWQLGQLRIEPIELPASISAQAFDETTHFVLTHHQAVCLAANLVVHHVFAGFEHVLSASPNPQEETARMKGLLQSFDDFETLMGQVLDTHAAVMNSEPWAHILEPVAASRHYLHTSLHINEAFERLERLNLVYRACLPQKMKI